MYSYASQNSYKDVIHAVIQYAILAYAGYQFLVSGSYVSTITTATISTYVEKAAATYYEFINHDSDTAKHLAEHFSNLTKCSNFFNPIIDKAASMVLADIKSTQAKIK